MKLLVLSDSHAGLSFMRRCIRCVRPDAMIHLGDYFDDGVSMAEENPHIVMHQVPGNCDRNRMIRFYPEVLCYEIFGVKVYMTHGHNQKVKLGRGALLHQARAAGAEVVLYGHTHCAECYREDDGLLVMNPGSCGSYSGSAGLIEIEDNIIKQIKILTNDDLEDVL